MSSDRAQQIEAAIRRRAAWRDADSDAWRLTDGGGDGLPGIWLDDFAGRWLLSTDAPSLELSLDPSLGFRSLYQKVLRKSDREPPSFVAGEPITSRFQITEEKIRYWIDFQVGYSQGLFLDQRSNRARVRSVARGISVLNTFAYTCGFGVAAAFAGAQTVNVDLSKHFLEWGKSNYKLNRIDPNQHEFYADDVFDRLRFLKRKQRIFDLVILDPPTFSRNRDGKIFRAADHFGQLVSAALGCVRPGGRLLCCNNSHQLPAPLFRAQIDQGLAARSARITATEPPPDFPGSNYLKTFWIEL
ncbi:MAG: class I SAM-dependent rRNA methyltransferase [Verrucomicrobia bacterium]|nr:class I SAM-dependent rRNA methyltransferase [Verrucomicrobiota bacterium]